MDAPPALNPCSQTLSAAESVSDNAGVFVPATSGGNYTLPAGCGGEDVPLKDPGVSSPVRQLNGDSNLLWPVVFGSNSRVSAAAPGEWSVPQENCFLPSATEVLPSKMVVSCCRCLVDFSFSGFYFLIDDDVFCFIGSWTLESWKHVLS